MRFAACTSAVFALSALLLVAEQTESIMGEWEDPGGSVIRIGHCGKGICMWLVSVSPSAPAFTDIHNSDPSLRSRPLCGLRIGSGFNARDDLHAAGGTLYDPKSGKTYHGEMTVVGPELHLRGYVGLPLFGETEVWKRPRGPVRTCRSPGDEF